MNSQRFPVELTTTEVAHLISLAAACQPDPRKTPDAVMATFYKAKAVPTGPIAVTVRN